MKKYIVKRTLLIFLTLFLITLLSYTIIRIAPGDYTTLKLGMEGALKAGSISQEILEQEKKLYGLDKPVIVGYAEWLAKFVRLDFGISRKDGRPVLTRIGEALPITLILNVISMIIIYIISIPMGIVSAVKKDKAFDRVSSLILFLLYSLPHFWIGLILLLYMASGEYLNLFPLGGIRSDWAAGAGFIPRLIDFCWHLVLPVITLTYGEFAFLARYTRANMLEVISQQYIMTARAKGLSNKRVIFIHAFRNSLIPLVTLMATLLPGLLGGTVIVESIFSIPGMGLLAYEAILSRDIPVIMAITTIAAILTLAGILAADLLYSLVDPRIRLEAKI
ncbi:MAG: diguanylate cyclase [Spirochaetes bacterium RBG_16_49_21]|nr:MAG: diguanylate cyclase [Spirochaetes bacterium RBG_16_49_21]